MYVHGLQRDGSESRDQALTFGQWCCEKIIQGGTLKI